MRICHSQWILQDGFNRTPDVDNLVSALEKLGCLGWEMVGDSVLGCGIGLIDVHALDRSAETDAGGSVELGSSDGMVEDEDAGCARAV